MIRGSNNTQQCVTEVEGRENPCKTGTCWEDLTLPAQPTVQENSLTCVSSKNTGAAWYAGARARGAACLLGIGCCGCCC